MWIAKIVVNYKPGILNPEAKTIKNALGSLGYEGIDDIETGKYFQLTFSEELSKDEVDKLTIDLCDRLLTNPVIQRYSYQLEEVSK